MICILCTQEAAKNSQFLAEYAQLIITVAQIFITGIIGFAAIYVSVKQAKIANAKFSFEMYKDRNLIVQKTILYLEYPVKKDTKEVRDFQIMLAEAKFLFGKEIGDYLDVIFTKSLEMLFYESAKSPSPDEHDEYTKNIAWFLDEVLTIEERFAPFFDFSTSIEPPFSRFGKSKANKKYA